MHRGSFVFHAIDANLREFVVAAFFLEIVSPNARLGLERGLILHAGAEVAFFAVDVSRNPVARNQVQAPAIHVEEERVPRGGRVRAVKADDIVILVFNPDAAEETPLA